MAHHIVRYMHSKTMMLTIVIAVAILAFFGINHFQSQEASALGCWLNGTYYTGHTPSNQYVNGVKVWGKIRHRGFIDTSGTFLSCIKGNVRSDAASTIDRVSWEGWKYEDDVEVDNWGSSCNNCDDGESSGSHQSWFLWGLGVTIKMEGKHYFKNGASYLWLDSARTVNYGPS